MQRGAQGLADEAGEVAWAAEERAAVLGNVGNTDDVDVLAHALSDAGSLVRDHAAWAMERVHSPRHGAAARPSQDAGTDSIVTAIDQPTRFPVRTAPAQRA